MYKTTQQSNDHLTRTGSASTKPAANGLIKDLPAWAREAEEYYNSVRMQYESLRQRLHDTRESVTYLRRRLKTTLPHEEFKRLSHQLDHDGPALVELEGETAQYKALARAAAVHAWGAVYYHCAERLLDIETRLKIERETREFLQRPPYDGIDPVRAQQSDEVKQRENRKDKLRKRRRVFRDHRPGQVTRVAFTDKD